MKINRELEEAKRKMNREMAEEQLRRDTELERKRVEARVATQIYKANEESKVAAERQKLKMASVANETALANAQAEEVNKQHMFSESKQLELSRARAETECKRRVFVKKQKLARLQEEAKLEQQEQQLEQERLARHEALETLREATNHKLTHQKQKFALARAKEQADHDNSVLRAQLEEEKNMGPSSLVRLQLDSTERIYKVSVYSAAHLRRSS
jgi:hypothetical protein